MLLQTQVRHKVKYDEESQIWCVRAPDVIKNLIKIANSIKMISTKALSNSAAHDPSCRVSQTDRGVSQGSPPLISSEERQKKKDGNRI